MKISLSKPSKMPGYGWSISARLCKNGGKLAKVPGSTCFLCYALKGRYVFPHVKAAHATRLAQWESDRPGWREAMVRQIRALKEPYFRWFDAGDLQSLEMLEDILFVAASTPLIKHWLPTREYSLVRKYLSAGGLVPANLVIRISDAMVDGVPVPGFTHTAGVASKGAAYTCPAPSQENSCGDCRACWDSSVPRVIYKAH